MHINSKQNNRENGSVASVTLTIIALIILAAVAVFVYLELKPRSICCVTPPPVSQKVTIEKYGFKVNVPSGFTKEETNDAGFFDELGLYELFIRVPSGYQTGTDFNIGLIEVIVSSSTAKCYVSSQDGGSLSSIKTINGADFHYDPAQPFQDAAMGGQRGLNSLFAAIHNGSCYRINETIGYRDLHGFAQPPYPPHFDEQKVNANFNAIIESFEFTR